MNKLNLVGRTLCLALMAAVFVPLSSQAIADVPLDVKERISLWPKGKVPDYDARQNEAVLEVVRVPEVRSDALVVVIGGGSYDHLPFVYNPAEMVEALCSNGVPCVNLRHRCPRPQGKAKHLSAWQDVQRAIRICRANAERWNVSRDKIGVIGFSAGGHCALLAAVSSQTPAYAPVDALDNLPCNVNFAVPAYPAYVLDGFDNNTNGFTDGRKGHEKDWTLPLGDELKFDSATPPIFLLHGTVDKLIPVMGTLIVFNRLLKMDVSVEMQILSRDGHGFLSDDNWRSQILKWMGDRGLLTGAPRAKSSFRTLECLPTPEHERNSEGSICEMPNGDLLFAYSLFGKGDSDFTEAVIATRRSSDGGKTWTSKDEIAVRNHGKVNVMSASLLRLKGDRVALFYLVKDGELDAWPAMRVSSDNGHTWGPFIRCAPEGAPRYRIFNNDRAIRLASGRILLPLANHNPDGGAIDWCALVACAYSDDDGATWKLGKPAPHHPADAAGAGVQIQEPGVVELSPGGEILLYARTNHGEQWFARSRDGGESWGEWAPSSLQSPLAPAKIVRLKNGDLCCAWNDMETYPQQRTKGPAWMCGHRSPLMLAVSRDGGKTWPIRRTLEGDLDGYFAYPSILELGDQLILSYGCVDDLRGCCVSVVPTKWIYETIPGSTGN